MPQGTIKTKTERGFGFIEQNGSQQDLFFHAKQVTSPTYEDLAVGDLVDYEIGKGRENKPCAENVRRVV